MSLLANILKIRVGEGHPVFLLFLLSFCCGAATVCFESASGAMFLVTFNAEQLSYVYMASALVTSLIGWIYIRLERRVAFESLLRGTLATLLLTVLALRALLLWTQGSWLQFLIFLWLDVLTMLANLATWGLTLEVLTVRQGKRLFGPINAGEQLAGVIFGYSMPLLVGLFRPDNLFLVTALALTVGLGVLSTFLQRYGDGISSGDEDDVREPDEEEDATSFLTLVKNPYLARIFLLSALTVVGFYSLEYLFYDQIENLHGDDPERLSALIGQVTGTAQLLTLLGAWFVSGRLLERFGVRTALILLPLALMVALLVAVGIGINSGLGLPFFGVIVATRVLDIFLRGTVEDETMLVLYQPLPTGQRASAQARAEGVVEPLSAFLAGLFLLAATQVNDDPRLIAALVLLPFGLWVLVSWDTGRAYAEALVHAIDRRVLSGNTLRLADASTLEIIQTRLRSPHPGEVIFCLDTLQRIEHPDLAQTLHQLVRHPSSVVRREVLQRLERYPSAEAVEALMARVEVEPDPEVRATAIRVLCAIGGTEAHSAVMARMEDPQVEVRQAVLLGLCRSGDMGALLVGADRIARLTGSPFAEDRRVAADILGELAAPTSHPLLRPLLWDRDLNVCRAALHAAGRLRHPALWPALLTRLGQPGLRASAAEALAGVGPGVLPRLDEAFREPGQRRMVRVRIAYICGRIGGAEATRLLREHSRERDPQVRGQVLQSLSVIRYAAAPAELAGLYQAIQDEVRGITRLLASFQDFPEEPQYLYLRSALREEVVAARNRIFHILSFLYDAKNMLLARDSLDHASAQRRAWAVEVVDLALNPELRPLILPLLDEHSEEERLGRLEIRFPQARMDRTARLRELIAREDPLISLWTRLCAIVAAVHQEARTLWDAIEPLLASREAVLRETGLWALASLDGRRAREPVRALRADPNETVAALAAHVLSQESAEAPMLLTVEKVIILKSVGIFSRTPEEVLVDVASVLKEVDVKAHETIFDKGDIGTSMYFIVNGRLRVHDGDITVAELGEREIVGELAVLDPQPRNASVTALEDTLLLQLDQEALYELMTDRVEVARGIIRVLCHKLRSATVAAAREVSQGG